MGWLALRVDVPSDAAAALADLLVEAGAPSVVTEAGAPGRMHVEAHVPADDHARIRTALERHLGTPAGVETTAVPEVDWEACFRHHHRPVAIGRRLLVAPPWDVPPAPGREVLVVEPGQAFGTGQHATTRTCLEEIEALVSAGGVASALDVGTGSGLLAAALARLGVPRVVALDADAAVLPLARANLAANRATHTLLLAGRADAVRATFDLVVANLLADTLVADADALAARTAPGGHLVVSGLLDTQVDTVAAAYPGWCVATVRAGEAWRTLTLVR